MAGLTNGTAYTFTVAATNAFGTGPSSSPSNSVTPKDPATPFSVSGRVATSEGTGISGVTMTFGLISGSANVPDDVTTDVNGLWSQSGFASNCTYRVTPYKHETHEILFLPHSKDFIAAQCDLNFTFTFRFLNNGDGTVTDIKTGLMWQRVDDEKRRNWADAVQYCANLILGGLDDWRLQLNWQHNLPLW